MRASRTGRSGRPARVGTASGRAYWWYVADALGRRSTTIAALACLAATLGLSACGDEPRQDAEEPSGDFPVEVVSAKFPPKQRLAETHDLTLEIENSGSETIPNLAVTIWTGDEKADGSFNVRSAQTDLADPNRPIWILENGYPKLLEAGVDADELDDEPSAGAEVASTDTYAFGPLAAGENLVAVWRVTPVKPGTYNVHYTIAAGLHGNAKAVTADGSPVEGEFVATITDRPPQTRVTESGEVVVIQK